MASRCFPWTVGLVLLSGCYALPDSSDQVVLGLASRVVDPEPLTTTAPGTMPDPGKTTRRLPDAIQPTGARQDGPASIDEDPVGPRAQLGSPLGALQPDNARQQSEAGSKDETVRPGPLKRPLLLPTDLLGTSAPPITWPRDKAERAKTVRQLYPPLPPLPPGTLPASGPQGRPLTLSDLQSLALANNPSIKNAVAGVEAVRGAVIQAGAYPNPTLAWEADTVGTGGGYYGGYIDQQIKGANKIKLAKAAATMDLENAQLALRKAQADLVTQVRTTYFAVLVALENVKVSGALVRFTDTVYRVQVDLLSGGEAAPYEPMQLRPLALQARLNLLQAHNQYEASWKQLAAALGLPGMPPTELAGRVDRPVPAFDYEEVLARVLNNHTDVLTGLTSVQKARYTLELAQVAPFPDPDVRMLVQKDYSTPPHLVVLSAVFALPMPVWDQNKGGIVQAKYQLTQATQAVQQTKLQLINAFADAYNRYTTARDQVRIAMQQIEDQVRVYRGVYERHGQAPDQVSFGDVVTAQQTLATYTTGYITALGLQWTAVADVANLMQTYDLFQTGRAQEVAPVPDLEHLLAPSCVQARDTGLDRQDQPPQAAVRRACSECAPEGGRSAPVAATLSFCQP